MNDNSQEELSTRKNTERTASEVGRRAAPRFALIIGIDNYVNCPKLCGAVNDAKAMKRFLQDVHGMPEDHIVTLYDEEATRKGMIKAFFDIVWDDRINKMDSILVFFAGHGTSLPAPPSWGLKGMAQCLIPQDYDKDADIMPLPDRTVGVMIENIARYKGDNITVILDCCHSASGAIFPDEGYVPRQVKLDIEIDRDLDLEIWVLQAGKYPGEFAFHGLRSHVLLAACGEKEEAYEYAGHGLFTTALLETLKKYALHDVTYIDILERIHLEKQTPYCEGLNRYRTLFDTKVAAGRHVWYPVRNEDGRYVISAGLSHGISPGVELNLYNSRRLRVGSVLVDDATSIDDFRSAINSSIAEVEFAKVARVGKVPLYLGNDSVLEGTLLALDESNTIAANFRIVENIEEAMLHATMGGDETAFKILDRRVKTLGLTDLPVKAAPTKLVQVLGAAAHFFWYLDLRNESGHPGLNNEVTVNFYLLEKDYDDFGTPMLVEAQSGFVREDPTLDNSQMIDFVVDLRGCYGIKIENKTPRDLYLNAFVFNNSNLSIVPWYLPNVCSTIHEAPLKKKETFTIGYGPGGSAPLEFGFGEGQNLDVGYLKIFFSTQPFDLSDIEQPSPFLDTHAPYDRGQRDGGQPQLPSSLSRFNYNQENGGNNGTRSRMTRPPTHADDIWFTLVMPIVQRRAEMD